MLRNGLEPWHVIVLVLVILLVFGGKKLPELARGSGRALRIFKAETKGVFTDDDDDEKAKQPGQLNTSAVPDPAAPKPAAPEVEPVRHDAGTD